jgi:drug/metabolite transporter (DMT)-like permease
MIRQPLSAESVARRAAPSERLRGIAFMMSGVAVFSVMDALMKRLSLHYAPLQVGCLRCLSSWILLLVPIAWGREWRALRPSNAPLHLLRGALGVTMLWGFVVAVRELSLAQTYSLFLAAPLLMTALSVPILGERVALRRWLAIVVGLSGVLVVLQPWGGHSFSLSAAAAAAVATVCYSLAALTVGTLGRDNSSLSMVFWYLLLVGIGCAAFAARDWRPVPPSDWGWLVGVGATGALGQLWLTEAFRRAPPSVVGPFEYTAILWAFAIDWVFWSASPSPNLLIGACTVIASGIFIIIDERRLGRVALTAANPPP